MSEASGWRAFEELVAAIEAEAAPRGARVRSPDRIRDRVTRRLREVDASIRFRAGTVDVLITIECRKRNRRAGDAWIEQLATKRERIGAAKTIAVSAAGFTKSAVTSAEHHGIELRELSSIRPEHVEGWFLPHGLVHVFRVVEAVECRVWHRASPTPELVDGTTASFRHDLVHGEFPPIALLNFIELKDPKQFWAVPLDGTKTRLTFELDATSPALIPVPLGVAQPDCGPLRVLLAEGEVSAQRVELSFLISYEAAILDRARGEHHLYQTPGGPAVQRSAFSGRVLGLPARFEHQSKEDGGIASSVEFPSGVRLPAAWFGISRKRKDEEGE